MRGEPSGEKIELRKCGKVWKLGIFFNVNPTHDFLG